MSRARIDLVALKVELRSLRARMQVAAGVEQERLLGEVEDLRSRVALAERRHAEKERVRDRKARQGSNDPSRPINAAEPEPSEADPAMDPDPAVDPMCGDDALEPLAEEAS